MDLVIPPIEVFVQNPQSSTWLKKIWVPWSQPEKGSPLPPGLRGARAKREPPNLTEYLCYGM